MVEEASVTVQEPSPYRSMVQGKPATIAFQRLRMGELACR
jgi:hypothetical protein